MITNIYHMLTRLYSLLLGRVLLSNKYTHTNEVFFIYPSYILSANKRNVVIGDKAIINGFLITEGDGRITIGKYTSIGRSSVIRSRMSVVIGDHCLLSSGVYILDNNSHSLNYLDRREDIHNSWLYARSAKTILNQNVVSKSVVIGDDVWIGRNSTILKGVSIGNRVVVATESVVTRDVPDDCVVAGNPAVVVKKLSNSEYKKME